MSLPWKVTIAFLGSVNKQAFKNLKKKKQQKTSIILRNLNECF